MKRTAIWAGILAAAISGPAGAAEPCRCEPHTPHGTEGAAVVFTGKVIRVDTDAQGRRVVHFRADKRYWGPVQSEMVVTELGPPACGPRFTPGTAYVVYGYPARSGGVAGFVTRPCDPDAEVSRAGSQLRDLEAYVRYARRNPMEFHFPGR